MKTQESPEDYLEAIYLIIKTTGDVRSIDIANHFGYSKASVSVAMKKLRERGYITMDHSGRITLTNSGLETAAKVHERHEVLTRFLVALHVDEKTAAADACRMEHILSEESFQAIRKWTNRLEN